MSKQQTAVEWLMNELANTGLLVTKDIDNLVAYSKAKQMEKEQQFRFFIAGQLSMEEGGKDFEQYYNETYDRTTNPNQDH